MGATLVMTVLTRHCWLLVISVVWRLWIRVVGRIVVSMPWIMLSSMLGVTVHRRRHPRMHVHIGMRWRIVGRVLRHWRALVVAIIVLIIFVDWIHTVHLIGLALIVLLLFRSELLPGISNQTSDGTAL